MPWKEPEPDHARDELVEGFRSLPMVKRMMEYFYVLDYSDEGHSSTDPYRGNLLVHVGMYEMGDRFGSPGLKKIAGAKLKSQCQILGDPESGPAILDAASNVYTSTPEGDRGLREIMSEAVAGVVLRARSILLESVDFKSFCLDHPEFVWDVMEKVIEKERDPDPWLGNVGAWHGRAQEWSGRGF
ncbi:MAG: hypothetical protein Q9219_005429 [cf. Caloplaca sp. 3 TL-2023]